jgi:hypothetical protein
MNGLKPAPQDVSAILAALTSGEFATLFETPAHAENLRVSVRVTLLTGLTLEALGNDPSSEFDELDYLRDDLNAALEFFHDLHATVQHLIGLPLPPWCWVDTLDWATFRSEYRKGISTLQDDSAPVLNRHAALIQLIQLQLFLWAQTFAMEPAGHS